MGFIAKPRGITCYVTRDDVHVKYVLDNVQNYYLLRNRQCTCYYLLNFVYSVTLQLVFSSATSAANYSVTLLGKTILSWFSFIPDSTVGRSNTRIRIVFSSDRVFYGPCQEQCKHINLYRDL